MQEGIDLCLGCRACETVCPTNVRYGDILMSAVEVLKENKDMDVIEKVNRTAAFKFALKNKSVLRIMNKGLYAYQVSGIQKVVKNYNLLKPIKKFNQMNKAMPDVILSKRITRNINPFRRNDLSIGSFQGCIMDSFLRTLTNLPSKS
ncbi:4Fe-4S binding protein [Jeotgalicoccus sp. WY2]|uniref:4Fe-4S binding protein n=1 Tax=Jeotgalicoccus sp. WY2 TaxID=2708346 RepID=UPI00352FF885